MQTASIIVDFRNARCANCKVLLRDDLQEKCDACGAVFDRVVSNHVGLAEKLQKKRDEAGIKHS